MNQTTTRRVRRSRPFSSSTSRRASNHNSNSPRRGGFNRNQGRSSDRSYGRSGGRPQGGRGRGGGRKMATFDPSQFINKNPVDSAPVTYEPKHTFNDFGLDGRLTKTIKDMGIKAPSPIQDQIIPEILKGRDVIGLAETGTGKTAAFLLPLIELTKKNEVNQTLILTPTRELALQVDAELRKLTKNFRFYSTICVGGTSIRPQIQSLRRKNHFVIGTPGRILDLIERKILRTDKIKAVVLDEADRMLDMGFINDMRKILGATPKDRHTLFFSATMTKGAHDLVNEFLRDPVTISVKKKDVTNSIEQDVVTYHHHDKFQTLVGLLNQPAFKRVLIFGSMKHSVEKLAKELHSKGISADSIHGNKNHTQRQRALARFKSGQTSVLVATDVAARGIHVDNVTHVINYDLPNTFEDYVHRIGRTGRGHERGQALTFVQKQTSR